MFQKSDWTNQRTNQKYSFRAILNHFQTLGRFCLELLILFKTSTMIIPVLYWNTSPSDNYHVILVTWYGHMINFDQSNNLYGYWWISHVIWINVILYLAQILYNSFISSYYYVQKLKNCSCMPPSGQNGSIPYRSGAGPTHDLLKEGSRVPQGWILPTLKSYWTVSFMLYSLSC